MIKKDKKIIFIVGPTATGKSEVAVKLAEKAKGEVVSCDSMQIYKGMNILASLPSKELLSKARHYLVERVSPEKEYDVSKYRLAALRAINKILKSGKTPIVVGGTGLYMNILVDGIFKIKEPDKAIRKRLYSLSIKKGNEFLYNKLKDVDKEAALKIHPNDIKRVLRALEVFEATGKPISLLHKQRRGLIDEYDVRIFCLNLSRDKLYKRIDQRVEKMFDSGVVGEVKNLIKKDLSKTAKYAIGIREIAGALKGEYDLEQAKLLMQKNTRNYAKKQLTWFRKDKRIKWINIKEKDTAERIAKHIWKELNEDTAYGTK